MLWAQQAEKQKGVCWSQIIKNNTQPSAGEIRRECASVCCGKSRDKKRVKCLSRFVYSFLRFGLLKWEHPTCVYVCASVFSYRRTFRTGIAQVVDDLRVQGGKYYIREK